MTRGEVAARADVNRETVRYYERRGLIPHPPRSAGGYRMYEEHYVARIRFVKRAQEIGFTLDEIEDLLALRFDSEGDCGEVRKKATEKLSDVRERIRDLKRIEEVLTRLSASCRGEGPTKECPILDAIGGDGVPETADT